VAHSIGGLLARRIVLEGKPELRGVGLLVEMGTPHNGASDWTGLGKSILPRGGKLVGEVQENSPFLISLRQRWKGLGDRPKTACWGSRNDAVVSLESAQADCDEASALPQLDHRGLVKPVSSQEDNYRIPMYRVREYLRGTEARNRQSELNANHYESQAPQNREMANDGVPQKMVQGGSEDGPRVGPVTSGGNSSVSIGSNNQINNSPIVTGNNNVINMQSSGEDPIALTAEDKLRMVEALKGSANGILMLICIGSGCEALEDVQEVLLQAGFKLTITKIGIFSDVTLSKGVHFYAAEPRVDKAVRDALRLARIKVRELTPGRLSGLCKSDSCLIIGNP
jgi:hypothetical protein